MKFPNAPGQCGICWVDLDGLDLEDFKKDTLRYRFGGLEDTQRSRFALCMTDLQRWKIFNLTPNSIPFKANIGQKFCQNPVHLLIQMFDINKIF